MAEEWLDGGGWRCICCGRVYGVKFWESLGSGGANTDLAGGEDFAAGVRPQLGGRVAGRGGRRRRFLSAQRVGESAMRSRREELGGEKGVSVDSEGQNEWGGAVRVRRRGLAVFGGEKL